MAIAKGSYGRLIYVEETAWGQTPDMPSCTLLQFTSESLAGAKDTLISNMLRPDRNVDYMIYGNQNAGGTITGELVYKLWDDFIAAALFNDWSADVLKNGIVEKSFTLEKGFTDISKYIPYRGMMVNTMTVRVAPNQIVTIELSLSGKEEGQASNTSIDDTVSLPAGVGSAPFDGFSGSMKEGGTATNLITAIDFTVNNNLADGFVVGSKSKAGVFAGRCNVSGTFSMYLEDLSIYSKFIGGLESSLEITLADSAGNQYKIEFPRVKYGGSTPTIGGEGPIVQDIPFTALYDNTEACTIKVTRINA